MDKRQVTKAEKETILLTSEADDVWSIFTYNSRLKKRLREFAAQHPDICKLTHEDRELGSVIYRVQKSRLSIRLTAPYSEARRKAASEYAKKNNNFSTSIQHD
ncbi:MAG: molecular chaperone [Eubacterium sp.]|nr:molecular chaperone [Eubacterium sp.]